VRYEQILNTFLRDFCRASISDWVGFIKDYTLPKYDRGELWGIQNEPLITTNLYRQKAKNDKKKRSKKKEDDAAAPADEEEDNNRVIFNPSLQACEDYMLSCVDQIIDANNEFLNLESELFRFLKMEAKPNFDIPKDEEEMRKRNLTWILDAKQAISRMVKENMVGPMALLDEYKQYEFVLNVDTDELLDSLFNVADAKYNKLELD
jgi:hypothetical protein